MEFINPQQATAHGSERKETSTSPSPAVENVYASLTHKPSLRNPETNLQHGHAYTRLLEFISLN
jgi:hypothetical protein